MNATIRHLRYFLAVADELSFTRAAERLHVAQPAVSAQVRALERDLGVMLLRRTTRRVELTEAGQSLAADVRRLLDGLDEAWVRARRAAEGSSGRLRIVYTASTAYEALPLILEELETRAPELVITADQLWATEVVGAVLSPRRRPRFGAPTESGTKTSWSTYSGGSRSPCLLAERAHWSRGRQWRCSICRTR